MKQSRSVSTQPPLDYIIARPRLRTPPPSDFTKPRPRLPSGKSWQDGLTVAMSDPDQIFEEDELTVTLYDAFPKARFHYLIVPKDDIHSVKELSRDNLELLKHIHTIAESLIERVRRREPNTPFRFGYHAVPSLNRLHLHIISQEFDSPKLKTPHHWNTFNTEYFMDSSKVIEDIETNGKIEFDDETYEALVDDRTMKCNFKDCPKGFEDISQLKRHLQQHYGPSRVPQRVFVPKNSSRHRRHTIK